MHDWLLIFLCFVNAAQRKKKIVRYVWFSWQDSHLIKLNTRTSRTCTSHDEAWFFFVLLVIGYDNSMIWWTFVFLCKFIFFSESQINMFSARLLVNRATFMPRCWMNWEMLLCVLSSFVAAGKYADRCLPVAT